MKFAFVNGTRQKPQRGLSGICPTCDRPMVAKCGEVKVWHWAHKGMRMCDPWWENETEWHRSWKDEFPLDWQEVVHRAQDGEKHIADVKTDQGWVIEFQHSYLNVEERRSRNAFYEKLVWVVDGTRRKNDGPQFHQAWIDGMRLAPNFQIRKVIVNQCSLIREWGDNGAPVLFDFVDGLWLWLLATGSSGDAYITPLPRARFVQIHRDGRIEIADSFRALVDCVAKLVADYETPPRTETATQAIPRTTQRPQNPLLRTRARRRL